MKTPYIPHLFEEAVKEKLRARHGWLTVGVSSSIPWPQQDVWLEYDGHEYVLHGVGGNEEQRPPCISTPCAQHDRRDEGYARLYRFASILGWFKGGHVDLTAGGWGSHPMLYSSNDTDTTTLHSGRYFNCNYMPVVEDDQVRKALAFMREGSRLRHVHVPYSFLSYFKVLESQFTSGERRSWIDANLEKLEGDAGKRVAELAAEGCTDVGKHLYESGRCAVAHASLGGEIVDPDVPADRRRITKDIEVISALARRYLQVDRGVPDARSVYATRDRVAPWHGLLPAATLDRLLRGEQIDDAGDLGELRTFKASVRLWPHEAPGPLRNMVFEAVGTEPGRVYFVAYNEPQNLILMFALDVERGRMHTMLEDSGLTEHVTSLTEAEVEHFTRFFHSVVANGLVEVCVAGLDPVACEIVIPTNIIPQAPEKMVAQEVARFRAEQAKRTHASVRVADSGQDISHPPSAAPSKP